MAKKTVIRLNHTLEEYNKKYGDKHARIVNKVDADKDNSLIEGRTWWLINEKYYEIPQSKCAPARWWTNMGTTGRVITCILGAGVIATAVAVPVALTMNQGQAASITVIGATVDKEHSKVELNKESTVAFTYADNKDFGKVNYVKVGDKEIANTLYTLVDGNTQSKKIVIKAEAMTSTKIEISVEVKDKEKIVYVTELICDHEKEMKVGDEISFDDLNVKIKPDNATDKTFTVMDPGKTNDVSPIEVDTVNRKIIAKEPGETQVLVIPNGADPEGEEAVGDACDITVKEGFTQVTKEQWEAAITLASRQSAESNFKLYKHHVNPSTQNGSSDDQTVYVNGYDIEFYKMTEPTISTLEGYEKEAPRSKLIEVIDYEADTEGYYHNYISNIEAKNEGSGPFFRKELDNIYDQLSYYGERETDFKFNESNGYYERTIVEKGKEKNETIRIKFNSDLHIESFIEVDNSDGSADVCEFSEYGEITIKAPEEEEIENSFELTKDSDGKYISAPYVFKTSGYNDIYCTIDAKAAGIDYTQEVKYTLCNEDESERNIYQWPYCYINDERLVLEETTENFITIPANTLSDDKNIITFVMTPKSGTITADKKLHAVVRFTPNPERQILHIYSISDDLTKHTEFENQLLEEGIVTEKYGTYYYGDVEVKFSKALRNDYSKWPEVVPYASRLKDQLDDDIKSRGNDVVDLYITENETNQYVFKDDKYSIDLSDINGVDYDDMFSYTIENNMNNEGKLKGLGLDITPSMFIYKADLAHNAKLGDTPEEVYKNYGQNIEKFNEIIKGLKDQGYQPFASLDDVYRMFTGMFSERFTYNLDGKQHFALPDNYTLFIKNAIEYCSNQYVRYNTEGAIRSWNHKEWYASMSDENTFGFIGPRWFIDDQLANNKREGEKANCWSACPAPNPSFWGGSNLSIAESSDSKDLAKQFIKDIFNKDKLKAGFKAIKTPNSKTLIEEYAKSPDTQYTIEFLGGVDGKTPQNPYNYILDIAKICKGSIITKDEYEAGCTDIFLGDPYNGILNHETSPDNVIEKIKELVLKQFPEIIIDKK